MLSRLIRIIPIMRSKPKGRVKIESKDRPLSLPVKVTGKLKKEYFDISVFIKMF